MQLNVHRTSFVLHNREFLQEQWINRLQIQIFVAYEWNEEKKFKYFLCQMEFGWAVCVTIWHMEGPAIRTNIDRWSDKSAQIGEMHAIRLEQEHTKEENYCLFLRDKFTHRQPKSLTPNRCYPTNWTQCEKQNRFLIDRSASGSE